MNSREHLTAKLEHLDLIADTFEASTRPEDIVRLARVLVDSADYQIPEQDFSMSDAEYVEALKEWWSEHRNTLDKASHLVRL